MDKEFTNQDRSRRYGKRKGDIVFMSDSPENSCEVTSIEFFDNNRIEVKELRTCVTYETVAEWWNIKTMVEDIKQI